MDSFRGEHPFWVSAAKDSFRLTGPIASAKKSPDMENAELKTYDLARFPDYSFDVTGQPYRLQCDRAREGAEMWWAVRRCWGFSRASM